MQNQLDECIEKVCQEGCEEVRKNIETLEKGGLPESLNTLNEKERRIVLEELKIIMSVYDKKGPN